MDICEDPVMVVRISALKVLDKYIIKNGISRLLIKGLTKDKKYLKQILALFIEDKSKEIQEIL